MNKEALKRGSGADSEIRNILLHCCESLPKAEITSEISVMRVF